MILRPKESPATPASSRASTLLNLHNPASRLVKRLKHLAIQTEAQQPVSTDLIAQQLESLVNLKRLELLLSLEDKWEIREQMDEAVATLGTDLDTQGNIRLLSTVIEQRRQRLNRQLIKLKKNDLLATRN